MKEINLYKKAGAFAENKDVARKIRVEELMPALSKGEKVVLNFEHVDGATQSFIHALISDVLRKFGAEVLDEITFKSCNKTVREIINIVTEYMQAGFENG